MPSFDPFTAALAALSRGEEVAARRLCRQALEAGRQDVDPARLLGVLLLRAGQPAEALGWLIQGGAPVAEQAGAWDELADQARQAGQLAQADRALQAAGRLLPGQAVIAIKRAELAFLREDDAAVEALLQTVPADDPAASAAQMLGACLLLKRGKAAEAAEILLRLLSTAPDSVDLRINYANALVALGRVAEAAAQYRAALASDPSAFEALSGLAVAERRLGGGAELEVDLRAALAEHPGWDDGWLTLGNLLVDQGRTAAAADCYREILARRPDDAGALNNLGSVLLLAGETAAALATLEQAVALAPDDPDKLSSLIFARDFDPSGDVAGQQALRRRWAARFAPLQPLAPFALDRDPERPLRIGYVSADFRRHSAAAAFAPLLLGNDPAQASLYLYSNSPIIDARTEQLRAGHVWRDITALDDPAAAALIRADHIDILVDLSGHSAGHRLPLFALRPAPIQATGWGHATGTGLPQIDVLFADPDTIPPAERALYAERIVDLPCLLGFVPPADAPESAWSDSAWPDSAWSHTAETEEGIIRLGCFNRLGKVGAACLELWARLLAAVPTARLVVKEPQLDEAPVRASFVARAAAAGIDPARLDLLGGSPQAEHLAALSRMDLALDPFPQGGGVSTLEALWMGVPVVTLRGTTLPQRLGASILSALGQPGWIAADEAAYVAIATNLAQDRSGRAALAGNLRARMAATALGNPRLYAAAVLQAYRDLWRNWCAQPIG